ncbi:unnamed protein product [Porites evermanni]|uniref:Apextrin C-terminal domain-containing protein n=1 Tax=Porites evermanni TaxID=104178 RepID=A0ABN8LR91_9CNID|nr:unnamed protein product [Porites evermanni]
MRIYFMVFTLLVYNKFHFFEVAGTRRRILPGSVAFRKNWTDLVVVPGSSQYNMLVGNIEKSIQEAFKNDSNLQNVRVIRLRKLEGTKNSTVHGNLEVDFQLELNNQALARSSVRRVFWVIKNGTLDGIPLQKGSLLLHGLGGSLPVFPNKWPSGDYGLPKPTSGCPDKNWREGFRYQDSENVQNTNLVSNGSHLSGRVSQHGVRQEFCMHHDTPAGESIPWPRGKYCIYRKGGKCPLGLSEGWIRWDDENRKIDFPNSLGGDLPDGIYGQNTLIYFCCSISGRKSAAISLPYKTPFYLIAYGSSECQQVTSEYLQFDDEDQENTNSHSRISPYGASEDPYNNRLYYCYYQPIPCDVIADAACLNRDPVTTEMEERIKVTFVPEKTTTRATKFMSGSGVGIFLMGTAFIAVFARRFITRSRAI